MARRGALGTVVLFARVPRLGRGKRRLARDVGNVAAWRFYRRQLAISVALTARQLGWRAVFAVEPAAAAVRPGPPFTSGRAARAPRFGQSGTDLGERMTRALRAAGPGPAVLLGADIPGVTPAALRRALVACRRADLVFGPATDGGFWLVGAKRPLPPGFFSGVPWSVPTTLEAAVAAAPCGWRVAFVDRLSDVDSAADLSPKCV